LDSSSHRGALAKQKIALLIDFDNVILGIEDPGFDVEVVVNVLRERGVVVLGRAYGDWYRHSRHRRRLMEQGIDLIETPVFGPIIKNSADMHMALDAFEIAHTQSHIDTFCVVSGDSDFLPLIKRLQSRDKNVIVIAGQKFTSDLVRRNCNEYISYENILAEMMGATEDVSTLDGAYQLLERTIHTLHERGIEVRSSTVKQMMVQLNPAFSERTFGHAQFRQFLDRAAREGVVRMGGRDPHSGELLVSLGEERQGERDSRDSRPDDRGRLESRSDRNDRSDNRAGGRFESRFDRFEPRDNRPERDSRAERFDRFEPRGERDNRAPAAEGRSDSRESRPEPRVEARAEPAEATPQVEAPEAVAGAEPEAAATEAGAPEREGRRRRGGRSRNVRPVEGAEGEATGEAADGTAQAGAEAVETEAAVEPAAVEAPNEGRSDSAEFVDHNSQLGRAPLRRGRLRFSARLGGTVSSAPEAAAAPVETPTLDALEADAALPEVVATEPDETAPAVTAVVDTNEAAVLQDQAEPGKRRTPRRKNARKKDAPAVDAPATDAAPEVEAQAEVPTPAEVPATPEVLAPAVDAPVEAAEPEAKKPPRRRSKAKAPATEAPAVEAPAVEAPAVEAPAAVEPVVEAAPAEESGDAGETAETAEKPRRVPRRRTRKKAEGEAAEPAA
jgi:uncharacterized protein (TIGR00288 family)